MVKRIFKKLFNIRDKTAVAQPKGFRQNTQIQLSLAKPAIKRDLSLAKQLSSRRGEATEVTADIIDIDALFYSLLFPSKTQNIGGVANNLEKAVISQVEHSLASPQEVADHVLKLPTRIAELDRCLSDDKTEVKALIALIEQDPVLSVELLKLCNSSVFRRSEKEVTSLHQAFVQLGREPLRRYVSTCLVREMIEIKPIYYRRFGLNIWRHSKQVAFLSVELAEGLSDTDQDAVFMLGLLHDVGKIAIFKMLIDAFYQAEPGEQPNSWLFRQIMTSKSLTLSALLARCWQLPQRFESSLNQLANMNAKPTEALAATVWRANLISECSMLYQAKKLDEACLARLLIDADLSREEFDGLHEKLKEF